MKMNALCERLLHRSFFEKKKKQLLWGTFLFVLILGAFLRGYALHDWLRFSPDQARDAIAAYEMSQGTIPLLGPVAGGTNFFLGPITIYWQWLAGTIFGFDDPSHLAYPDFAFSVLALPLLFLLVSRLFGRGYGLVAMLLSAISPFLIEFGRFAWNPNSMPFFTILFLLAAEGVAFASGRKRFLWAIAFGIAFGVGVQLHSFLFVLLPILSIALLVFMSIRKLFSWRIFGIIFALALFFNIPQIIHEYQTGLSNTRALFVKVYGETGMHVADGETLISGEEPEVAPPLSERMTRAVLCVSQSSVFLLTSLGNSEECGKLSLLKKKHPWRQYGSIFMESVGILFAFGGMILLWRFVRRETDFRRKFLLAATLTFVISLYLLMIPVSNELSNRYFLAAAFAPVVFLAAWGKYLLERFPVGSKRILLSVFAFVILGILVADVMYLKDRFEAYSAGTMSNGDVCVLGEFEPIARFISERMSPGEEASMVGMRNYVRRFTKSIDYFLNLEGKSAERWNEDGVPIDADRIFLIRKKSSEHDTMTEMEGLPVRDRITSGKVSVYELGHRSFRLTVVADIHAGGKKKREKSYANTVYPRNFRENLEKVKATNPEQILVVGDMINFGEDADRAREVKEALEGIPTLWVKGNHDGKEDFVVFSDQADQVFDREGWRFVILDSSEIDSNKVGGITEAQVNWVETQLKTERKVVFAMHHPMLEFGQEGYPVHLPYARLKQVLESAGNVKYVFSGHVHVRNLCYEESGIRYCAQRALSLREYEGSFSEYILD